ncbi:hypothetical protein PPYR_00361 [Photinus pyralis]|uniref:Protein krueppel n=1 Tax=Photinus pyralis TaxID=7054 RepID=A0A5N4B1B0_PHOPY|nr:hypothetical protein PPYR_00361 [Photinus pyralis]
MERREASIIPEGVDRDLEDCQDNEVLVQMLPESGLISINIICRLCANPNERIIGIYSEEGISNDLANKMNTYLPIKVSEADHLPLQCCWSCASTVLAWHELVVASVEADRRLRELQSVEDKQIVIADDCSCIEDPNSPCTNDVTISLDAEKDRVKDSQWMYECKRETFEAVKDEEYFSCTICNKKFEAEDNLNIHYSLVHDNKKRRESKQFVCYICEVSYKRKSNIIKHIKSEHSAIQLGNTEPLENILRSFEKCTVCNKAFEKRSSLCKHMRDEHGEKKPRTRRNKSDIVAEHFCDVCRKGFTRKFDMQKHRKLKHPTAPTIETMPTEQQKTSQLLKRCQVPGGDNKTYYKCEICGKLFRQSYNFVRHQTVHTGVRAFFCHICGKNFRVSGGLHRHITEHHYGVKKYHCDICGRGFAAKATRDDHRNIHTNDRPFICDICGKAFRQKASLHIHKLFHGNNYRFSCSECDKKFRRASELKVHSWVHTGYKPHQCKICEAKFRLSQDLKRHVKIHNKLSECVCTECGSTFSQERYLKNHKKTHLVKSVFP